MTTQTNMINQDKISAIIVDDEQDGRSLLRRMLSAHAAVITIVGEAASAADARGLIETLQPELVFLDIQLSGKSGFSVLEGYDHIPFEVIFVTSYSHYALTAIKFNALDYLLKPIDTDELKVATLKACSKIRYKRNSEAQLLSLLESLDHQKNLKKIAVHVKDTVLLIEQRQITHIKAQGPYSVIHVQSGELYTTAISIKEFELYFGERSPFMRINRGILVNIDFISSYSKGEPCMIIVQKEITFEVSRRKKQDILDRLKAKVSFK